MSRNSILLPLAALVAAPLAAQDAWSDYVATLGTRFRSADRWVLAVSSPPSEKATEARPEDLFLRLMASDEFLMDTVPAEAAQALGRARGWKEGDLHWVLISPAGESVQEGVGQPTAATALDALRHAGFLPRWERLATFLKEHPDQGEARWAALQDALSLAAIRIGALEAKGTLIQPPAGESSSLRPPLSFATASDPSGGLEAARVLGEVADALEPILGLPAWQDSRWLMFLGIQLREWDVSQNPRLYSILTRLYEGLLERLEAYPTRDQLWVPLAQFGSMIGRDPLEAANRIPIQAGEAWPSPVYLRMILEGLSRRQDWASALAFLDGLQLPEPEPGPTAERWKAFCSRRADLQIQRLQALLLLERWDEAQGAMEEARRWTGSRWKALSQSLRMSLRRLGPGQKARFEGLIALPELKDPEPLPALPVPRLVLLDTPAWTLEWDRLKRTEPLQAWDPGELRWEHANAETARALRERFGWGEGPLWVVLLEDKLITHATTLPTAQELADRLQGISPGHLHRLALALQKAPRNLILRRERAEAILARRPTGSAEAQASEDAALSRAPLLFPEGWKPSPETWQWSAQKVLPELEQELKSWPSRPEAWRAWLQWAEQHPSRPSALTLVRGISIWGSETRWSAWLPKEVHLAVAEELRRSGRFEEMRAWFQEAWDGIGARPIPFGNGMGFGRDARIKDIESSIVTPLREALTALRRDQELVALDDAFAAMKGTDRSPGRRRATP